MPLTQLQRDVLQVIAAHRSEASHFAGGTVLHAAEDSPRFSRDFDIFHEAEEEVARASEADVAALRAAGYEIETLRGDWSGPSSFRKARLVHGEDELEIDWALDTAYRFFPIEQDPVLGWRLHRFDMAANKALALSARSVTRDYVDIVELEKSYPLEAIVWAACGKDPGFTPLLLLELMRRFARVEPHQLATIQARHLDPVALKVAWIEMSLRAEEEITRVADTRPDLPIGVAFVDDRAHPGWIGRNPTLRVHPPSLRGCWPLLQPAPGKDSTSAPPNTHSP